jgi:hypothetical protein
VTALDLSGLRVVEVSWVNGKPSSHAFVITAASAYWTPRRLEMLRDALTTRLAAEVPR